MIMSFMDNDNPVFKAFGVDKDKNVIEHVLEMCNMNSSLSLSEGVLFFIRGIMEDKWR